MIWVLFVVVAVLLVGAFAALIVGRLGYDPLSAATTTQSDPVLDDDFSAADIGTVRFDTALRGYRMDQVDALLDRLQDRIAELEADRTYRDPRDPRDPGNPEPAKLERHEPWSTSS